MQQKPFVGTTYARLPASGVSGSSPCSVPARSLRERMPCAIGPQYKQQAQKINVSEYQSLFHICLTVDVCGRGPPGGWGPLAGGGRGSCRGPRRALPGNSATALVAGKDFATASETASGLLYGQGRGVVKKKKVGKSNSFQPRVLRKRSKIR